MEIPWPAWDMELEQTEKKKARRTERKGTERGMSLESLLKK
jgi:hypothetical protein